MNPTNHDPAPEATSVTLAPVPAAAGPILFNDHGGYVHSTSYSPDGKRYLTVGNGKGIVWDTESRRKLHVFNAEFASFSGDAKNLFVLENDEFRTLDAGTGKTLAAKPRERPPIKLGGFWAAFAKDGTMRVEFDGVRQHLRGDFRGELPTLAGQHEHNPVGSMMVPNYGRSGAFSPDGKFFAGIHAATPEYKQVGCVTIWKPNGDRVGTINRGVNRTASSFAWSPNGKEIAVGYGDGVRVFDAGTMQELRMLDDPKKRWGDPPPHTTALAWSADGKTIAAAIIEGGELRQPLQGR